MKKVKINIIRTDRVLSQTSIKLSDYVINPYRGCELGCLYCYSKNNKNMESRRKNWGCFVDIKINTLEVLEKELNKINAKNIRVLLGSITEIFQPVERKYRLTKQILELLKKKKIPLIILTKSSLIREYIDLLTYSDENIIYFTYNTKEVKRLFEKATPNNKLRLNIMKLLLENNIKLTVYISPFLPFISDHKTIMDDLSILPGKGFHVYFEGYNMRMGNWQDVKAKLPGSLSGKYYSIYSSEKNYNKYWEDLKGEVLTYNKRFNYRIKFFNYPFNDYFQNEL